MHVSYATYDGGPDLKADVSSGLLDALNDLKPSRLFSLRQEFPDAWNQLINDAAGPTRTCTLHLSKAHFPAFLDYDYGGQTASGETIEPRPITMEVTSLTAYLSPHGAIPADDVDIELNGQQPGTDTELGIPTFDLTSAPGAPSSIGNTDVAYDLIVAGTLRVEDWDDLYLLMDYDVSKQA
jgi:hypothetical protein